MSRQIVTEKFIRRDLEAAKAAAAGAGDREAKADDYTTKIVKLIPSETVALYLFLSGVIAAAKPDVAEQGPLLTFVFVVLFLATLLYLRRVAGVKSHLQLGISAVAFLVWVFSLGGPFPYLLPMIGLSYDQLWGAVLLPIFTFIAPILDNGYTGPPA